MHVEAHSSIPTSYDGQGAAAVSFVQDIGAELLRNDLVEKYAKGVRL